MQGRDIFAKDVHDVWVITITSHVYTCMCIMYGKSLEQAEDMAKIILGYERGCAAPILSCLPHIFCSALQFMAPPFWDFIHFKIAYQWDHSYISNINTVKLVYKDHPRDHQDVFLICSWSSLIYRFNSMESIRLETCKMRSL